MTVLVMGIVLLALSLLTHLCVWRVRLPQRQIRALLVVFSITPAAVLLAGHLLRMVPALSAAEIVRVALFYASCSLVYIILYTAIEVQSPTLAIVMHVSRAGEEGCATDELFARFGQGNELMTRLLLAKDGRLIQCEGEKYRLTASGRLCARAFDAASRIFGLDSGG